MVCSVQIYGLDWRKATKEKRKKEIEPEEAVTETISEREIKAKGGETWKDELRNIVDEALKTSESIGEFKKFLSENNVTLSRFSEATISYKLGEHKAVRGDTLGGDYTSAAGRDAIKHNKSEEKQVEQVARKEKLSLDQIIAQAEKKKMSGTSENSITKKERTVCRDLGRVAGMKRSEVDAICDFAVKATWEEKQELWQEYKEAKNQFWQEYNARKLELEQEIDEAYKKRRKAKNAEWALNPRNRRRSLIGMLLAYIFIRRNQLSIIYEFEIDRLKYLQSELRKAATEFKKDTSEAQETLRKKNLPLDEYIERVKQLQDSAEKLVENSQEHLYKTIDNSDRWSRDSNRMSR